MFLLATAEVKVVPYSVLRANYALVFWHGVERVHKVDVGAFRYAVEELVWLDDV